MSESKLYNFIELEKEENYRYYSSQKIDKSKYKRYYQSYSSEVESPNKKTIEQLRRHKETLDFAIKYVENQVLRGFRYGQIVYPQSLHKDYRWYVLKFVETKLRLAKTKEETKGSQKYWVSGCNIKTYGFRDKNRNSKFQCFVEFISAYKDETSTIKLNLRMSKKAYENRHLFYLDGFDLVFRQNTTYVRHVSEQLVQNKKDNGIVTYMTIDAWSNIHCVTTNSQSLDKKSDSIYYTTKNTRMTKFVKNILLKIKSMEHKESYHKYFTVVCQRVFNNVKSLVNSNDEYKIILFDAMDIKSKFYSQLRKEFVSMVKERAKQYGISVELRHELIEDIEKKVFEYREHLNERAIDKKPFKKKELKSHIRWSEIALSALMFEYNKFLPVLQTGSKSTVNPEKKIDSNGSRVVSLPKPEYGSFSAYVRFCKKCNAFTDLAICRKDYIAIVKGRAKTYYDEYKALLKSLEYQETHYQVPKEFNYESCSNETAALEAAKADGWC